ncbi:MAG: hypothetical protein ACJ760_11930 [Thermoleophilaceae bacterium]
MRFRTALATAAVTAAGLGSAAGAAPAAAAKTCTWGGTPASPAGVSRFDPVTNLPSPWPLRFRASGFLGGDCRGRFRFNGQMDAGSSCSAIAFEGRATGLPGVARFVGTSDLGVAPARLYDRRGRLTGSENAQFLTNSNLTDCSKPGGLTRVRFSSVIRLLG